MAIKFTKLTRSNIRKLQSHQQVVEHGIKFERLANADGRYSVNVMIDSQRIHRVIGRESEGTTRTQAEDFIQKVRRDAREGRLALPKGRKTALSFRDAAEKYLHRLPEEGGKDLKMKHCRLNQHLAPFFGSLALSKLSNFNIEQYKKTRRDEGAKFGTINRELAALSHLFNKAIEWGWIDRRPAKIKRFSEDRGRITYLTADQLQRLIEMAKLDQNPQIYPFIEIGLGTAMRRSEILSIRREHVYLDRLMIYIPNAKAGAREQPITQELSKFLFDYMATLPSDSPWLFPSLTARSGHAVDIRKPFRRVVAAADMNPDVVVRHTLRHTAITHLVQAGVDLPTVMRISGHKTLIMVERYSHQNGPHIQAAMDKLEARYHKTG